MSHLRSAALVIALVAPVAAKAQTIPSPIRYVEATQTVSPFIGYLLTDRGQVDAGPHSAPIFGVSWGVRFAGPLSGEVALAAAPTNRTVYQGIGVGDERVREERGETSQFLVLGDAMLKFSFTGPRTWNGLAPYAVGGVGVVTDLSDSPDIEQEFGENQVFEFGPAFAVVAGAGTDWLLSERLALRVDLRDRLWRLTTPSGLASPGMEESEWTHNVAVSLGAALYF